MNDERWLALSETGDECDVVALVLLPMLEVPNAIDFFRKIELADLERQAKPGGLRQGFLTGPEPIERRHEIGMRRIKRLKLTRMGKGRSHIKIGMGRIEMLDIEAQLQALR